MVKRYLIVSDNHGSMRNLKRVAKSFRGKIEAVIHCGDIEADPDALEELAGCPVYVARGNCDFYFSRDDEALFEMGDHVALVTHGDRYGISWGYGDLIERAQMMGADLVFFGHTHRPAYHVFKDENVTMLNPGSIDRPRQFEPHGPTFAVLDLHEDGRIEPTFFLLDWKTGKKVYTFDIEDYQR